MKPTSQLFKEVTELIYSMLVADKRSLKYGVPIVELERDYEEMESTPIPICELGFRCLMNFLESLARNDKITIGERDGMTVVYLREDELITGPKASRQKHTRGEKILTSLTFRSAELYRPPVLQLHMLSNIVKVVHRALDGVLISKILQCVKEQLPYRFEKQHLIRQLQTVNDEIIIEGNFIYSKVQLQMKNLIEKHPKGVWCTAFPALYKCEYSTLLPYEELGFLSINEFAMYFCNIFQCVRKGDTSAIKLFDAKHPAVIKNCETSHCYVQKQETVPESLGDKVDINEGYQDPPVITDWAVTSLDKILKKLETANHVIDELVKQVAGLESQLEAAKLNGFSENSGHENIECEPRQLYVSPASPPMLRRPKNANIDGVIGSYGFEYRPKEPYFDDDD